MKILDKIKEVRHTSAPKFEYSKINEYIYVGTNQCCTLHFKKSLLSKKIKADISVEGEKLDKPYGVDFFLWIPVKDHKAPTYKQLKVGAKSLKELVDNKIKTFVHCRLGHGRGPMLVSAYFILEGKTTEQAMDFVKKKRPIMHLDKVQVKALLDFEKKVRKKR